jgi:hypothetical protein
VASKTRQKKGMGFPFLMVSGTESNPSYLQVVGIKGE